MKKYFLAIFIVVFMATSLSARAVSVGQATEEEAISTAETLISAFDEIIATGLESQYADIWAYGALLDWKALMVETGGYKGIKSSNATVGDNQTMVTVEILGVTKNAVVEFILYNDGITPPQITMYSKFSLDTALGESGLGSMLTVFNTFMVVLLFIMLLRRKAPASEAGGKAIDHAIAGIVRHEELVGNQELAAVIAAAIAAHEGLSSADGLVVRSIRKHRKSGSRRLA
jgi:hypothetical protein